MEGMSEVPVEDGVNGRVEGAVAIANPEEEFKEGVGNPTGFPAHTIQAVAKEKGKPANNKHSHDNSQDKCESLLPGLGDLLPG